MDSFDLVAGHLEGDLLVGKDIALLNQRTAADDDEELPLAVVPVLPLGDAGLADVDAELAAVDGLDQLGKGAAVVAVHLEREFESIRREIAKIEAVELLGEAAVGNGWHHQRFRLRLELLQQIDDLAERDLVGERHIAISSVFILHGN